MDDIEMELDLGEGLGPADDEIDFNAPAPAPIETSEAPPIAMDADPVPTKVHLRGLDEMTTKDIKAYVGEHYTEEVPDIEWIDDTSANLAFTSTEVAAQALEALSHTSSSAGGAGDLNGSTDTLQLRSAKPSTAKPGTELAVRLAVSTDRKKARAADESRFYLMHPEHDPRERRRRGGRGGERSDSRDGMRRRRYGSHEQARRRRDDERQGFDASMYDEENGDEKMSGADSDSDNDRRRQRRRGGRHARDAYRPGRSRSRSPISRREDNKGKELFSSGTRTAQTQAANSGKELFAARSAASSALAGDMSLPSIQENGSGAADDAPPPPPAAATRELFPSKKRTNLSSGGSLFSRITAPAPGGGGSGSGGGGGALSIKGAAGLSIKGASSSSTGTERKLRELFPDKDRNRGKELMDRVTPAGGREARKERSRAETFY